ncbi:MAG: glycosyl hydrolase family 18 protein, partial [Polyangiales bacterium]
ALDVAPGAPDADAGTPHADAAAETADALALADTAPSSDATSASEGGTVVTLGYYTGDAPSYSALKSFTSYVHMISSDVFDVVSDGTVTGSDDLGGNAYAKAHGVTSFACVSNYSSTLGDFDPALGHSAMVTNRTAVIANILEIASGVYDGVNIDFESLAFSTNVADDRAAYSAFIHDLSTTLHAHGLQLVISVPAKSADSATDTWSYPYDFAALAADVDFMQIMTYDENGPGWSGPGPVSGADWVDNCVAYTTTVVPKHKILIGLPAYGYDWDLTASTPASSTYVGKSVSWTGFGALLATAGAATHWDATTSSPYVDYTSADGHKHELWYEDAASITAKTKLVGTRGIAGYSMWSLGQEDLTFWQAATAGAP